MGVVASLGLVLGFVVFVFLAFYREYKCMFRRYKPEHFGLDVFDQVTRWQTSEWQARARSKGVTLREWQRLCDQQLDWVDATIGHRSTIKGAV